MIIDAMKMALEALEGLRDLFYQDTIEALRAAIEAAEWAEPDECQYAKDVSMPEYRCVGKCQYATPQPAIPADWQPIETAPRDGTDVLIYTMAGSMYVAGYDDAFSNVWRIRNDEGVNARVVTHWMPLPAAPKPENNHDRS